MDGFVDYYLDVKKVSIVFYFVKIFVFFKSI